MRPRAGSRLHRRDPGRATPAELEAALAPFRRPQARTPFDLPASFVIREDCFGHLCMRFTPAARQTVLAHLGDAADLADDDVADELLELTERELGLAYYEERGYATRYTHRELMTVLRVLVRLDPAATLPELPPSFLTAVAASERRRRAGTLMRDGVKPRPEDLEHDAEAAIEAWNALGSTAELSSLADCLFQAVRRRRPSNWEELARVVQWDPLRKTTIEVAARLWTQKLQLPARAKKALFGFTIMLLRLVDRTFPTALNENILESVRKQLGKALAPHRP